MSDALYVRIAPAFTPSGCGPCQFIGLSLADDGRPICLRSGRRVGHWLVAERVGLCGSSSALDLGLPDLPRRVRRRGRTPLREGCCGAPPCFRHPPRRTYYRRLPHLASACSSTASGHRAHPEGQRARRVHLGLAGRGTGRAYLASTPSAASFGFTRQAIVNDDLGALADLSAAWLSFNALCFFEAQFLVDLLVSPSAGLGPGHGRHQGPCSTSIIHNVCGGAPQRLAEVTVVCSPGSPCGGQTF